MGVYASSLEYVIQKAFVENCIKNKQGQFANIGCGFGVATIPALNEGCRVIACDLEKRSLEVLKKKSL